MSKNSLNMEFEKVEITAAPRTLSAKWTIDMEQDIKASIFGEPEGVIIHPYSEDDTQHIAWNYKVVGEELQNGHIKIIKDVTKKRKVGKILAREKFDEIYFEEAL
jgi:hypothetical protein